MGKVSREGREKTQSGVNRFGAEKVGRGRVERRPGSVDQSGTAVWGPPGREWHE